MNATRLVLMEQSGQLGNRLFPFAHLIAFAAEHGCKVVNFGLREYRNFFVGPRQGLFTSYPIHGFPFPMGERGFRGWLTAKRCRLETKLSRRLLGEGKLNRWARRMARFQDYDSHHYIDLDDPQIARAFTADKMLLLRGWQLRGYELARKHHAALQRYFRPIPAVEAKVAALQQRLRAEHGMVIGVHIRRGDYETFYEGAFLFSHEEYEARLHHLREIYRERNPCFLLCSNEPIPPGAFTGLPVTLGVGEMVADLYSLAACDLIIGPPSTFSGWASFYNRVPLHVMRDRHALPTPESFQVFQEIELLYTKERLPREARTQCR